MLDNVRRPLLGLAILGMLALTAGFLPRHAAAGDPRARVAIEVEGALGNELLGAGTWLPIVVTVRNRTGSTHRGRLRASHDTYRSPSPAVDHPFVVPAHGSVAIPMLVPGNGSPSGTVTVVATSSRGDELGAGARSFSFRPGPSILVVGDRALPDVLGGETFTDPREEYRSDGVASRVRPIVGVPAIDLADSASPVHQLPATPLAYGGIRLVVARISALRVVNPIERNALIDWVHTGGRLLVLLGSSADTPEWLDALYDRPTPDVRRDGESIRLGYGWLTLTNADFPGDVESPTRFSESWLGLAIAGALEANVSPGDVPAVAVGWASAHPRGSPVLDRDAASQLDPNRVSAFWLAVAGILLVLYVVAVGPLNFKLLVRRPALALLTTPLLAGICAVLLLGVGVLHKGVRNRYRRVELVDATEGARRALSTRFTAAFFARPSAVEITFDRPRLGTIQASRNDTLGTTSRLDSFLSRRPDAPATAHLSGWRQRVDRFDVGTWDTIGLQEQGVLPLGHGVTVEATPAGGRVYNRTGRWLRSAVVLSGARACRIGDIAPGASGLFSGCRWDRRIELDPSRHSQATRDPFSFLRYQSYPYHDVPRQAAGHLASDETLRDLISPFVSQLRPPHALPVLLARLDPDRADPFDGAVTREADVALLRVVPALPPSPDWMVPVGTLDPTSGEELDR